MLIQSFRLQTFLKAVAALALLVASANAHAYFIDGIPVSCGMVPVVDGHYGPMNDIAVFNKQAIVVNLDKMTPQLPTNVKLFVFAHECGHVMRGPNENDADCFASKLGRDQGWFTPGNFPYLIQFMKNWQGDWTHMPGPMRLQHIAWCFSDPGPP